MSIIKNATKAIAENIKALPGAYTSANGVTFLGGSGNDEVIVRGNKNKINAEEGNDKILVVGDCNIVADSADENNIAIYGDCNDIDLGSGKDTVIAVGNNTSVSKEDGSLLLGAVGDNVKIASTAKENIIGAYGDNYCMNLCDESVNDVRSLDYWLEDGSDERLITIDDEGTRISLKDAIEVTDADGTVKTLNEYDNSTAERKANLDFFKNNFSNIYNKLTYTGTETSDPIVLSEELVGMNKDEIADEYDLSEEERAILDSVDLNEKMSDGNSVYSIAFSPRKQEYVIVKRDGATHSRAVSDNECIAFNVSTVEEYLEDYIRTETTTTTDTYTTNGVKNWTINVGKGTLNATISATEGCININRCCETTDIDNVTITGGHISTKVTENIYDTEYQKETFVLSGFAGSTWNSPLILDMNGDGKVSAASGYGVDINNDGKADGAATDGDKMLAMSDLNGSGTIDGNEVFGDQTVSPFTGKKLNAANGFEALKLIAEEAEERGFECIENGEVNLKKLAEALATVDVQLGFISDNNNSELEEIKNVKSINVENYTESNETGKVQHRQQGSFETEDGETRKIDDVWFAI